jgi:hypothetical protein
MFNKAKRYGTKTFRLHPKTIKKLAKIKKHSGLSYNRLFLEMISKYDKEKST